jgi:hypothetical protein
MDEGHECDKSHILSPLTDRLQIVVCTATVTIIVIPSVPYILVQKESQHWISPPSLCKIFIERSREARTARYWQKGELQNSDQFWPALLIPGYATAVARDARQAVVSGENCVMVTLFSF